MQGYDAWKLRSPYDDEDEDEEEDYCGICKCDPCACDEIYEQEQDREYDDYPD